MVEGCEDVQKQRRTLEGEAHKNGGARPQCILLLDVKTGLGVKLTGTELKEWETKGREAFVPFKKKWTKTSRGTVKERQGRSE